MGSGQVVPNPKPHPSKRHRSYPRVFSGSLHRLLLFGGGEVNPGDPEALNLSLAAQVRLRETWPRAQSGFCFGFCVGKSFRARSMAMTFELDFILPFG